MSSLGVSLKWVFTNKKFIRSNTQWNAYLCFPGVTIYSFDKPSVKGALKCAVQEKSGIENTTPA